VVRLSVFVHRRRHPRRHRHLGRRMPCCSAP